MRPALRYSLIVFAVLLGVAAGVGLSRAPHWLADRIRVGLTQRAARRGIDLQLGPIYVDPLSEVTLDGVILRDKTEAASQPFARIGRLQVHYELDGVFRPRIFLKHIDILATEVRATRDAAGKTNLEAVLKRILSARDDDEKGGGGGLRKYLSKHVPDIDIKGLRASFDDASGGGASAVAGVDLRHLRVTDAAIEVRNSAPVQEMTRLELKARATVAGVGQPILGTGQFEFPKRQGWLSVRMPGDMTVESHGYRVHVGSLTAYSDGRLALGPLHLERIDAGNRLFSLDVQDITAKIDVVAGPEPTLPPELAAQIPAPARMALRHVRELAIREPVIVARRPAARAPVGEDSDDEDEAAIEPPLGAAAHKAPARPASVAKGKVAAIPAPGQKKPTEAGDGSAVRDLFAHLCGDNADRLERELGRLRAVLAGIPIPLVTVQHGRARYEDQGQPGGPQSGELSDFNAKILRNPGEDVVTLQLDFDVPGQKKTDNAVSGRVDTKTGDAELKVHLDRLPLAPYAAVLPPALTLEPTSSLHDVVLSLLYGATDRHMTLEGHGAFDHVDLDSPRISRQRLMDLSARAQGRVELDLARQTLKLTDAELVIGHVHALISSSVQRFRTAPAFDLKVKIPTVPCQEVVASVPVGFAPLLDGMTCEGAMSFEIGAFLDTANMNSLKLDFDAALGTVKITSMGKYIRFDLFDAPFEHHARQKDGTLYTFVTGPDSEHWAPIGAISNNFVKVLTTTEDGNFFGHHGFSWESFKNAAIENLKRGRFVRGASTITQQLVKNLFFVEREKTISRKVQEAVTTWQIERTLTKQQILELYLNIIELGPKIYGIKAASLTYFNRPPADLTLLQAIWLGNIVPNPRAYYHQFRDGKAGENTKATLCWIGSVMLTRDKITEDEFRRLGACEVVFGGGPDGSEEPVDPGLGHEGDPSVAPPEAQPDKGVPAPSVAPDQQP